MAVAVRRYFDSEDPRRFAQAIERENEKYSWERMVETIERVAKQIDA
jgi:hypothetical protein